MSDEERLYLRTRYTILRTGKRKGPTTKALKAHKHISGCSQSAIGWSTGPPMEELEKVPKELKRSATL